ncbi:MAG: hypothetical protein N2449_08830, partial [Bacteroidales bacterium]|nr:hypothetical protein [Bacteroidales bacterium]
MRFICVINIFISTSILCQTFSGTIKNFNNRSFAIYAIFADSLIFIDSIRTNNKGEFSYPLYETMKKRSPDNIKAAKHVTFRIQLNWNQFADVIGNNDYGKQTINIPHSDNPQPKKNEKDIVLNTVFRPSQWNNF